MTNTMIVVIKTLMNLLSCFTISVGLLLLGRDLVPRFYIFLINVARCPDKLMCLSYCDIITIIINIYSFSLAPTIIWS